MEESDRKKKIDKAVLFLTIQLYALELIKSRHSEGNRTIF